MKFVRFLYKGESVYGVMEQDFVKLIEGDIFSKFDITDQTLNLNQLELLAPVEPGKVICVGLNYKDHAKELSMPIPDEPILFMKPETSVIANGQAVIYPKGVSRLDYEAELGVVIKKEAKDVAETDSAKFILGYTCINDVTARDLQKKDVQWTRAKSFDTFCPLGPCISTDIKPGRLNIQLYLNGELKQDSNTENFIFSIEFLVSFISRVMTIKPGDVIATGTPKGVGPMNRGDKVEVKIEGIGSLINTIIQTEK